MGSRGQVLKTGGFKEYRYHTISRFNNVRFVVQNEGKSIKLPEMSSSRWAVYTTLRRDGKIKSISFFNGSRKKFKEIDFKEHYGINPHVHAFDAKTGLRDDERVEPRKLTGYEEKRIQRIVNFYKKHGLAEIAATYYKNTGR